MGENLPAQGYGHPSLWLATQPRLPTRPFGRVGYGERSSPTFLTKATTSLGQKNNAHFSYTPFRRHVQALTFSSSRITRKTGRFGIIDTFSHHFIHASFR